MTYDELELLLIYFAQKLPVDFSKSFVDAYFNWKTGGHVIQHARLSIIESVDKGGKPTYSTHDFYF